MMVFIHLMEQIIVKVMRQWVLRSATPAEGDVTILVVPENAPEQCINGKSLMMGLSINITSHPMAAEFTDISASVER